MNYGEVTYKLRFRVPGTLQKEQEAHINNYASIDLLETPVFENGEWVALFNGLDEDGQLIDVMDIAFTLAEHLWSQGSQVSWNFDDSELIEDGQASPAFPAVEIDG